MERLHPIDENQVIREVIPGGDEPRSIKLYPNHASVRVVRWFEGKRFIPGFVVAMVDDGRPVPESFLNRESDESLADAEGLSHAA